MRKLGKLEQAAKVIALCLPPVVMSSIGLAVLSRKKGAAVSWVNGWRLLGLPRGEPAPDEAFAR
jgi:hypothetical protein